MDYKEYGKWLAVGLFGFMGLSWDAFFFIGMIMGNGTVTISEPNTLVLWCEFTTISLLALFVLIVTVKHMANTRKVGIRKIKA